MLNSRMEQLLQLKLQERLRKQEVLYTAQST